jgi:hypothetical protein
MSAQLTEMSKKNYDEIPKLRDKLEQAEAKKQMLDKKMVKVERELKEYQDLCAG